MLPENTKRICILPFEILPSNQGRITSCAKSNGQPDIKLKIVVQVPKMYPLFCVLSTTATASQNQALATKRKSRKKLFTIY